MKSMKRLAAQGNDGDLHPAQAADVLELRLGLRLRHTRLAKNLRLSDVAAKSGYSESLISKIENNKALPSLNTLHRLAKALGTTISALFHDGGDGGIVTHPGQRLVLRNVGERGALAEGIENELLIPLGADTQLQASLMRIEVGGRSDGLHQHQGDEAGYVIKGDVILTVGVSSYRLGPGDAFYYSSEQPHGISNADTVPAEILWCNTPPSL
jgi:transcriptional regulator with XRE-family HTH domain